MQRAYVRYPGGINIDDAVKRTLYKIFSNKLAEKYNWESFPDVGKSHCAISKL